MNAPPHAGHRNVHATGLILGSRGIMLRGPSGAGKSLLALELLERYGRAGLPALLVADDRLDLEAGPTGLTMHAPLAIAGQIELRGRGIVHRPYAPTAPVHLIVNLVDALVRMVEEDELTTDLLGVTLPCCPVPRRGVVDSAHQILLIGEALRSLELAEPGRRQEFT